MTIRLRLRGDADLLAFLPYHLGYHPTDSVVLVAMHGNRMGLTARFDLTDDPVAMTRLAAEVAAPLAREEPEGVVLVAYEDEPGRSDAVLGVLQPAIRDAGTTQIAVMVVRDRKWEARHCTDPRCCAQEPQPIPSAADSPAVAELVGMGVSPLRTRADLRAFVALDPQASASVEEVLKARSVAWAGEAFGLPPDPDPRAVTAHRMRALHTWATVLDSSEDAPDLTPEEVVAAVHALRDVDVRDGVIAWMCPGSLPFEHLKPDLVDLLVTLLPVPVWAVHDQRPAETPGAVARDREALMAARRLEQRLAALCRAVPDRLCAGVLTVLASYAWWEGSGALAREAVERALRHQPDYRLAVLTEKMIDLAMRPGRAPFQDPSTVRTHLSAG
jgi:Fe-S-cluster formation regulator IscX/YfhJ